MKVLSVVNTLNRGGVEVQLLQSLPWLTDNGIKMDVCAVGPGMLDGEYESHGCRLHHIPKSANCLLTARHFESLLRKGEYDCIHCNLGHASGGYALGASKVRVPIAVSLHQAVPVSLRSWQRKPGLAQIRKAWLSWHRYLTDKYAQVIVGHSEVNIRNYVANWNHDPKRYRVIMNGIEFRNELMSRTDARKLLGIQGPGLTLLHVGSFKQEKNHAGLFEILRNIVQQDPRVNLICVGGAQASKPHLEQQLEKMGMKQNVRFEGTQANVWPYYAAADVFVFPSVAEGFGNVLVESQGANLPVVASDIEPHRESVAPSQHRFLFSLPDYCRAADLVLEQADAAQRMSNDWVKQAQTHVQSKFSIERFASDLRNLYLDLAETKNTQTQTALESQSVITSNPLSSRAA